MKVTVLVENTCRMDGMEAEHGLSLYIEALGRRILFDMGQTDMFYRNALRLGIDPGETDLAVISHGHYDHGGGLEKFLEINKTAPVYIHNAAFLPHYNGFDKYIGLDTACRDSSRIVFTSENTAVGNGLTLYAPGKEDIGKVPFCSLYEKTDRGFVQDDFCHEQYLMIEENGKRVLFSGCSHRGAVNIIRQYDPDVLVGGLHFSKLSEGELDDEAAKMKKFKAVYHTCHCTGLEQYEQLKGALDRISYLSAGTQITI